MFSGHVYLGSPGVGGSADAMTFKYKLSRRLALLKDRWVLLAVTTHAVALAVGACARPVTGPQAPNSPVVRIVPATCGNSSRTVAHRPATAFPSP